TMRRIGLMVMMLTAGCDSAPPPAPPANQATQTPVNLVQTAPAGCADAWVVALDPESFANNGADKHFAAARLAMFRDQIEQALRGAVNAACKAGEVAPAMAAPIKHVAVTSASGAAEPTFSVGEDPAVLHLEWTFAEEDLTIPSEMELRGGMVCWTGPQSEACAEREP
ncbi:MAG: hypothetical protein ABIR87_08435, partial [Sphingomicrobium sp.]